MAQAFSDDLPDGHSGKFFDGGLDSLLLICPSGCLSGRAATSEVSDLANVRFAPKEVVRL
jgi:hypothetical protein